MGVRKSILSPTFTPTQTADTTNLTDNTYLAIKGGSGTQRWRVTEIYAGGQAAASAVNALLLAGDSTVGVTLSLGSGASDTLLDSSAGALSTACTGFNTATTKPQRSSSIRYLALPFNAFGGSVHWYADPNSDAPTGLGNTQPLGEMSLSSANVGTAGAMGAHVIYESY